MAVRSRHGVPHAWALGGLVWLAPAAGALAAPAVPHEHVEFAVNVEKAKGHLLVSRDVYAARQPARARLHGAHPVQEIGARLFGPAARISAELGERLRQALKRPGQDLDAGVPSARYALTVTRVFAAMDDAVARVVPAPVRSEPAFHITVIRELLSEIVEEYDEAWKDGTIVQVVEYQDAYGFLVRARALYRELARRPAGGAAASVERDFDALARALPGVAPPRSPARP